MNLKQLAVVKWIELEGDEVELGDCPQFLFLVENFNPERIQKSYLSIYADVEVGDTLEDIFLREISNSYFNGNPVNNVRVLSISVVKSFG